MSLGGGYQQSNSSNEASSFGPLGSGPLRNASQRELSTFLLGDRGPGGVQLRPSLLGTLEGRTTQPTGYTTPNLTATGLLPEQQNAFTEAVNQAMSRASGNFANRGFLRPENIQAIAGSAAQNVAPSFANMIAQNVGQRTQAPLIQEDILRNRFNDLIQALGLGGTLLGGQSLSQGKSSSMGVQAQGGTGGKP